MKFYTADLTDIEYEDNKKKAYEMYNQGVTPNYSSGICEAVTAGYGRLDFYGYWEFPLDVDQQALEIINKSY